MTRFVGGLEATAVALIALGQPLCDRLYDPHLTAIALGIGHRRHRQGRIWGRTIDLAEMDTLSGRADQHSGQQQTDPARCCASELEVINYRATAL